jgi:hypothetical protein
MACLTPEFLAILKMLYVTMKQRKINNLIKT